MLLFADDQDNRVIVTVLGKDKVGIIAGVTGVLAQVNANILDISQTIMQEFLVMVMLVDISRCHVDFGTLKNLLMAKGEEIGVQVNAQHEEVFRFMHRI